MRELFIEKVIDESVNFLENSQRIKLKEILEEILNKFISSKEIKGCSVRTLKYYKDNITKMLDTVNLSINEITTETLRNYLSNYKIIQMQVW